MFNSFVRLSFVSLFVLADASAIEPLPRASGTSGHGVYFTGACAERVGMKVFGSRGAGGNDTAALIGHAQASVQELLERCPQMQEVRADVRSSKNPSLQSYFTMSRASDWKVGNMTGIGEIQSLLDSAGYGIFVGPRPIYSKAYWRLEDSRFDAVYGNDLENRMVATHIARRSPDDFRIRGQIYELGYNESGISCDSSREGYALWGSFTMTVARKFDAMPLSISWCAENDEPGKAVETEFFDQPWYGSPSSKPASTAEQLLEQLAAAPGVIDAADTQQAREPLIDREFYRVFATKPDFCAHREFDLIYRVNHERRGSLFNEKFDQSVSNIVGTFAGRRCGQGNRFTVNNYSAGDPDLWDSVEYEFINTAPEDVGVPFRVRSRTASVRAKAFDQSLAEQRFGICEGPFCEFSGGRYLNAIYRGDLDLVRQIDGLHQAALYRFKQRQVAQLGGGLLAQAYDVTIDPKDQQMLKQVANKYMHAYGMWGDSCLDPGAETKTYSYTTPIVMETDEYGTTTSGGITIETTYTNNADFFPLRNQLASHRGAKRSDEPTNLEVKGPIFEGIVKLTQSGDCRSPEVKQFERELRRLTEEVLSSPGALAPTDAVSPPIPQRIVGPAFAPLSARSAPTVAWNAPVPLPTFSGAGETGDGPARPMNQQERMNKANEEMVAAQKQFEDQLNAIQLRTAQAAKAGSSQAEIMKLMQEGQAEMLRLQQQMQEELLRIQQKYM